MVSLAMHANSLGHIYCSGGDARARRGGKLSVPGPLVATVSAFLAVGS